MRVVLIHTSALIPPENGGAKCHRLLMEELAARGHECEVIVPFTNKASGFGQPLGELERRELHYQIKDGVVSLRHNNVLYSGCLLHSELPGYLDGVLRQRPADRVLVTEGLGALTRALLQVSLERAPNRVLLRVQTLHYLPFGPASAAPDEELTALLKRAAGVFTQSHFAAEYLLRWAGMHAEVLRFPVYGALSDHADLRRHPETNERTLITLINPCRLKGISILAALAQKNPALSFGAVPTWGTTKEDLTLLAGLSNIELLSKNEDIDVIFAKTRILLAPTLGFELFGLTIVEAMIRGIPALASDLGGHRESGLGAAKLVPARPIEWIRVRGAQDRVLPFVPPQDIVPWEDALLSLQEQARYQALSDESRRAAERFVASLRWDPFEDFILEAR